MSAPRDLEAINFRLTSAVGDIEQFNKDCELYNTEWKELELTAKKIAIIALTTLLMPVATIAIGVTIVKLYTYGKLSALAALTLAGLYTLLGASIIPHLPLFVRQEMIKRHEQKCVELNTKIKQIVAVTTLESFKITQDTSIEETAFTDEELARMDKYVDRERYDWKYRYKVTEQKQLAKPVDVSPDCATPLKLTELSQTDNLQEIKDRFLPWRMLLRDMTAPENESRIASWAPVNILGHRAVSCSPRKQYDMILRPGACSLNIEWRVGVRSQPYGAIILYNEDNGTDDPKIPRGIAKTPDEFLALIPGGVGSQIIRKPQASA